MNNFGPMGPRGRMMPPMGREFNPLRGPNPRVFRKDPMFDPMMRRTGDPYHPVPPDPMMRNLDPLSVQAQVIVIDPERRCRDYAEMILSKLKRVGLICDIIILDKFMSPSQVIDDATARGLLYTASVNLQNEAHQSITINILQGQPQEHRNMPFQDALKLVTRNFDAHLLKLTDSKAAPPAIVGSENVEKVEEIDPALSLLLINLAEGKTLRLADLDKVLKYLNDKRDKMTGGPKRGLPSTSHQQSVVPHSNNAPKPVQPPVSKIPSLTKEPPQATLQAEDLQAKITKLFGDSNKQQTTVGVKPIPTSAPLFPSSIPTYSQSDQKKPTVGIDFTNPTVQNALQNLMKTGPNILESIRNTTTSSLSSLVQNPISTVVSGSSSVGYNNSQDRYGSHDLYEQQSGLQQDNLSQDDNQYQDSRPAKRAKPGRHAIAGFY